MNRRIGWVAMIALLLGGLTVAAFSDSGPRTNGERARELSTSIKCPQCRGQSVADSDAPVARTIRAEIARRIGAGETDTEIRDALVDRFGEDVLLTPGADGFVGLVWVLPVAGLIMALAGLAAVFRKWQIAPAPPTPDDADRDLVAAALAED